MKNIPSLHYAAVVLAVLFISSCSTVPPVVHHAAAASAMPGVSAAEPTAPAEPTAESPQRAGVQGPSGTAAQPSGSAAAKTPPTKSVLPQKRETAVASNSGSQAVPQKRTTTIRPTYVDELLSRMTVEQKVGQLLMITVSEPTTGKELATLDSSFRNLFRTLQPGGVILFGGNLENVPQSIRLINALQEMSRVRLFVATDEEGGTVSRLTASGHIPATPIPSAQLIGDTQDPQLAYETGRVIGEEMGALGFNMDLAPVADVLTNPRNEVIGTRSFGTQAQLVARMVAEEVRGLQSVGICAVLKHFPGHGGTANDTHVSTVVDPESFSTMKRIALVPFERGIDAGASAVLIAHVEYPDVTGSHTPASLSPVIVNHLLRRELGFDGVVMTDAMNMAAVTKFAPPNEAAVDAVRAGCDIVLMPLDVPAVYQALLAAVRDGSIPERRLDQSVRRILDLKERMHILTPRAEATVAEADSIIGNSAHRSLVRRIYAEETARRTSY